MVATCSTTETAVLRSVPRKLLRANESLSYAARFAPPTVLGRDEGVKNTTKGLEAKAPFVRADQGFLNGDPVQ